MRPMRPMRQSRGAALLTSLIMVLVVAILGVAIGRQVIIMRQNSTSHYDQTLSFANAESGLWEAEAVISENAYTTKKLSLDDPDTLVVAQFADDSWWATAANWNGAAEVLNGTTLLEGRPSYLIEDAGQEVSLVMGLNLPKRRFFRVTSRANGKGDAVAYMQSYYAVME